MMTGKQTIPALLLLIPALIQASTITLSINPAPKAGPCPLLVERFLDEYREIIPHSRLVLNGPEDKKDGPDHFTVLCDAEERRITLKGNDEQRYELRYQETAQGFDAADWVPLQKRMREPTPELSSLAPSTSTTALPSAKPAEAAKKPWWPWVVAGVLGAGAVAATVMVLNRGPEHAHVGTR